MGAMFSNRSVLTQYVQPGLIVWACLAGPMVSHALHAQPRAANTKATSAPASSTPAAPVPTALPKEMSRSYLIGAGDVLQISVANEPQASVLSVVVRSDGAISLPLVKEITVVGMTPQALEQLITQKLAARFVRDPDVTVVVKEIHSEKVYVIGAVRKAGPIVLQGPLTVLQAISESGGFTDYAKRSKVYILRTEHGKQSHLLFNYDAVIRGEHPEQNVILLPGDSLVVP
jgi:polysaccharide export outer membrane protein